MSANRSEQSAAEPLVASVSCLDGTVDVPSTHPGYDKIKRLTDLVLASTALVLTSPFLLVIAVLVKLTSAGPVLFRSERIGMGGEPFDMLKFRTMYVDADHSAQIEFNRRELGGELGDLEEYSLSDDNRITRVGRFLRKSSLDELPQLWNVVRGDMSLVGPRPSLDWEVELFESRFLARLGVPPGITGLWQVSGRRSIDMIGMLEIDIDYVEQRSSRLDMKILLKTIPTVLKGKGAT
jgi:lipopolysaccharide/colanic/teichoic acid biosynthesis glycosyltransferase